MKETPLLMTSLMVRATLDGRKTNTRRLRGLELINEHPDHFRFIRVGKSAVSEKYGAEFECLLDDIQGDPGRVIFVPCPFGGPQDSIWIRETWGVHPCFNGIKPSDLDESSARPSLAYRADIPANDSKQSHYVWRPSIFMPRWASRISRKLVNVWPERVQGISEADAMAEGCDANKSEAAIVLGWYEKPRRAFHRLWD